MKSRTDFRFLHFLKNFIISFFHEISLKMFVWVCPMNLGTKKYYFWGVLFLQMAKRAKPIFFKKKYFDQNFSYFFGPSDRKFFPDSKMVWLFDYSPKLADLRRIFFYTFENGLFPYFKAGLPWGTFRGKNLSENGPNYLDWTYYEGLWWKMGPKKFWNFKVSDYTNTVPPVPE